MRIKNLAIVALTVMALVSATGAFATITCGPITDNGGGSVDMTVSTDNGTFNSATEVGNVGGVMFSAGTCSGPGLMTCTWNATGTPGLTPQSITINFTSTGGDDMDCTLSDGDGLPVELVEFSVE